MLVSPHQNPVEPDTPTQRDPIHHPHKQGHPGPDERDFDLPEPDDEMDEDA